MARSYPPRTNAAPLTAAASATTALTSQLHQPQPAPIALSSTAATIQTHASMRAPGRPSRTAVVNHPRRASTG